MNPIDRAVAAWQSTIDRSRARSPGFDHVWQARQRYQSMFGPRLAAAIAYYGFFAAFAVGLLGYSILGFVLVKGIKYLSPHALTQTAQFCGSLDPASCGAFSHAIVGTIEQVGIAAILSIPFGVLVAVYIVEYGTSRLSSGVRFLVDVMTGVPFCTLMVTSLAAPV